MSRKILLIFLLIIFILFGASITIILKHLDKEESKSLTFTHDWFIILLMFFSEMIGLPLSCLFSNKSKKEEDSEQESINEENQDKYEDTSDTEIRNKKAKKYLLIIIPFLLDTIVTFLSNVSLDYLPGSIHSVIKQMALIIFTLLLSKFCLKNKHIIDHYISIPIIIIGSVFVGLSIGFNSIKEFEPKDIIIGLVLLLISILLQSIQMIFEEYYIRKYNNNQFFLLGFEGLFGFAFNIILCIIFYHIKCENDTSSKYNEIFCTKGGDNEWRVENIIFAFEQMGSNITILILIIVLIFLIAGFTSFSISIVKYRGAMTRNIIENFRSFLVWIYFLFPWVKEGLRENFDWYRLVGLIFNIIAILMYFGIFKIDEKF